MRKKELNPNQRIGKIASFVQAHLNEKAVKHNGNIHDPIYRWEHTQRVANYGKLIAEAEGADVEVVTAACLLHDIAHFECEGDYKDHGRKGADISRPFLESLNYGPEIINNICYSVAVHVDGEAGFDHAETLEARCMSDADNIDRFSAYRILQWCVPEMHQFPKLNEKLTKRIETLKEYRSRAMILETVTGDRLFKQQLDRQIDFFEALLDDYRITLVPILED
jgi:putative nucleotidyltransferase with HDIG domain